MQRRPAHNPMREGNLAQSFLTACHNPGDVLFYDVSNGTQRRRTETTTMKSNGNATRLAMVLPYIAILTAAAFCLADVVRSL